MQVLAKQISSAILPVEKIIAEFRRNFKFDLALRAFASLLTGAIFSVIISE